MEEASPIDWLLDAQTPSIRYLTLRLLEGCPADDPRVIEARRAVVEYGPAAEILQRQSPRGDWKGEHSYYTPKYTSTHWSMMLLAELGMDGEDERMRRGAAFMLGAALPWEKGSRLPARLDLCCLFGNILRYTAHCAMQDDPRAVEMVSFLGRCALENGWACSYNSEAPCAWGAARTLWGLAAVPCEKRSGLMNEIIASGVKMLLEDHDFNAADYPTGVGKRHHLWDETSFPLFYQADKLFILRVLGELGFQAHPGAAGARAWLRERQRSGGRWRGSSPYRMRTYPGMGRGEETDRWVTLHALLALKNAGASVGADLSAG